MRGRITLGPRKADQQSVLASRFGEHVDALAVRAGQKMSRYSTSYNPSPITNASPIIEAFRRDPIGVKGKDPLLRSLWRDGMKEATNLEQVLDFLFFVRNNLRREGTEVFAFFIAPLTYTGTKPDIDYKARNYERQVVATPIAAEFISQKYRGKDTYVFSQATMLGYEHGADSTEPRILSYFASRGITTYEAVQREFHRYCDIIVQHVATDLVPGFKWHKSKGTRREIEVGEMHGKVIHYDAYHHPPLVEVATKIRGFSEAAKA